MKHQHLLPTWYKVYLLWVHYQMSVVVFGITEVDNVPSAIAYSRSRSDSPL
jgi:hypothetical protein